MYVLPLGLYALCSCLTICLFVILYIFKNATNYIFLTQTNAINKITNLINTIK